MDKGEIGRWQTVAIWMALLVYLVARLCQLYANRLPSMLVVLLHVVPPAVFALAHGSVVYRVRGILTFVAICVGVATVSESLSLRTGFPFGYYSFTDVMGPKVAGLPVLLVLAYVGIGYCAWVLGLLILGHRGKPLSGVRVVALPVLASFLMTVWDLSMDAAWGTIDKAWIWRDGGAYFGVPLSNFFGWYLTAYGFYQAFALYCGRREMPVPPASVSFWRAPVLFYGLCAFGNLLLLKLPMAAVATDASGREWATHDILGACALVSVLVMGPMALLAWLRVEDQTGKY